MRGQRTRQASSISRSIGDIGISRGAGGGLGELGQRAVAQLDAPDADEVRLEVDVIPHEPELLGRPRAHQERRGVVDALVEVVARGGEKPRHLVGRQHGLARLIALALEAGPGMAGGRNS